MSEGTTAESPSSSNEAERLAVSIKNSGNPILLKDIKLSGVAATAAQPGETIMVWTKLGLTSDEPAFHRIVEGLNSVISYSVQQTGTTLQLGNANNVLLVIHHDDSAELWVDTAAIAIKVMAKRDVSAGMAIFENDIADVIGFDFPAVKIQPTDRIICILRQDWRFALFFDFNPDGNLSLGEVNTRLGTLYRTLKYRHLYDTIADETTFSRLVGAGWFPFVEILGSDFRELAACCEAGFPLQDVEAKLVARFGEERLQRMFNRWIRKPHLVSKEPLLRSAIRAFSEKDAVAVIKIILTEIEGVLDNAYRASHGKRKSRKVDELLKFAVASAEQKAGAVNTLLLPDAFGRYLHDHTFADFDPTNSMGTAGARHAVGHGAAEAISYTQTRALQALLTLDQVAFYT